MRSIRDDRGDAGVARRGFMKMAGAAGLAAGAAGTAVAQPDAPPPTTEPVLSDMTTADILVGAAIAFGATHAFGIVGDGVNPIIEALRKRQNEIAFVGVRHEESAAFMASGMGKHGGRLGLCVATTGPGAVHLLNGLYDAAYDGAPVLVLTGTTFHDLEGMRFMQSVNTVKLMQDVALFDEEVTGPAHAVMVGNRACRAALGGRGVAHLTVAKDIQAMRLAADKPSGENHGGRTSSVWTRPRSTPAADQIRAAADLLNAGQRVAILAGQGCFGAQDSLVGVADALAAPIAKSYLAKALLPDDHYLTTGGIGHLGTAPSSWAMHNCDTVLILGSTMPWIDYYPKPGQARGVQVDIKADRIGLRYPVEIGLEGDVGETLKALLPLLRRKADRSFPTEMQARMGAWHARLAQIAGDQPRAGIRPQAAMKVLSDLAPANAMYSLDCGANTHFAARHIQLKAGQSWSGSGMLVSMASGLPLGISAAFANPDRPSLVVVGDGGFAMLMAELSTAVVHKLNLKVMILNNDSLGEVKFEQKEIGNPEYGCALGHIDFAAYARAVGAAGIGVTTLAELTPAVRTALAQPGPVVIDVQVDAEEPTLQPDKLSA